MLNNCPACKNLNIAITLGARTPLRAEGFSKTQHNSFLMIACLPACSQGKQTPRRSAFQANKQPNNSHVSQNPRRLRDVFGGRSIAASQCSLVSLRSHPNPSWSAAFEQHLSRCFYSRQRGKSSQKSRTAGAGDELLSQQLLWQRMLLATVCYHNRKILDLWSGVRIWILNLIRITSWIRIWIVGPAPSYWC